MSDIADIKANVDAHLRSLVTFYDDEMSPFLLRIYVYVLIHSDLIDKAVNFR
jgi:hypothetical protein